MANVDRIWFADERKRCVARESETDYMAQKKKASVDSAASKASNDVKKVASTRAKPAVAKKAAVKAAAPKKAASKTTAKAKAPTKKPAAKKAAPKTVKKSSAATPAAAKKTTKATASKSAAAKSAAAKARPAAKAAATTKSKIAAAAQVVAARRAAAAKSSNSSGRPLKAVAAAAPAAAKRSSAPVAAAKPEVVEAPKKPVGAKHGFKLHEYVVYPAHGVGQIVGIEEQEIAGMSLELFVITFDKDKMTLRVPTAKVDAMRKLSETSVVEKAMHTLKGRARIKRTMWSRRAQEYENKINSGDLIFIAEVVRDLYRSESQPEQSYSERQLYEAALDRMARELAAVEKLDERGAIQRITDVLSKSAKGRRQAEEEKAEAEAAAEAEGSDGAAAA
ncbi:MAG: CarD family transcriptional regulator [Hyphomicrobiaceae bacterium]